MIAHVSTRSTFSRRFHLAYISSTSGLLIQTGDLHRMTNDENHITGLRNVLSVVARSAQHDIRFFHSFNPDYFSQPELYATTKYSSNKTTKDLLGKSRGLIWFKNCHHRMSWLCVGYSQLNRHNVGYLTILRADQIKHREQLS